MPHNVSFCLVHLVVLGFSVTFLIVEQVGDEFGLGEGALRKEDLDVDQGL